MDAIVQDALQVWSLPPRGRRKEWSTEQDAELLRLKELGLSGSQIGKEIGRTRNAVLGRLHRLGCCAPKGILLTEEQKREWRGRRNEIKRERRGSPRKIRLPRVVEQPDGAVADIVPLNVEFLDLKQNQCRYPYGEGPFLFCGHAKERGESYCAAHMAVCWRPPQARSDYWNSRA